MQTSHKNHIVYINNTEILLCLISYIIMKERIIRKLELNRVYLCSNARAQL